MSREELAELQRKLSMMSVTGIQDFYRAAYYRSRLENGVVPPARAIQELVQAWKAMQLVSHPFGVLLVHPACPFDRH